MYLLGGRLGYTFSQGGIDYVLFYANGINPWLVLVVGPIYFVVYFVVFYGLIRMFNLKTPGREDDEVDVGEARGGRGQPVLPAARAGVRRPEQHHRPGRLHHPAAGRRQGHQQGGPGS